MLGVGERYRREISMERNLVLSSPRGVSSRDTLLWQVWSGGARGGVHGVIVASEPLETTLPGLSAWRLLGKDKMLSFHPSEGVRVECLSEECTPDLNADLGAVQEAC
jgi:hypothetical protein